MSQYIGKTISLISNKGIRYLGILDNIDADNGTVSLTQVRSFGTEGRVHDVTKMVAPKSDIFGHVMFKGSDIQDLNILDCDINQVVPEPMPKQQQSPPAPVSPQVQAPAPQQYQQPPPPQQQQPQLPQQEQREQPKQQEQPAPKAEKSENQTHRTVYQAHNNNNNNNNNNSNNSRPPRRQVEIPKDDFDFESNNAKFQREEDEQQAAAETYNKKSSFFDTLSSSTEPNNDRMRWSEEKNLNYDTFGQTSLHRGRGRGRGRGGYRGRGGRGGYRGRGGYNNNNRNQKQPEWA